MSWEPSFKTMPPTVTILDREASQVSPLPAIVSILGIAIVL